MSSPPIARLTELQLVDIVLQHEPGWEDAWWTLVRRSQSIIRRVVTPFGRDPQQVHHELLAHLSEGQWRRLEQYRRDPQARLGSWLATVVQRLMEDQAASQSQEPAHVQPANPWEYGGVLDSLEETDRTDEPLYVRRAAAEAVQRSISSLRHLRSQEVLRRYYYRDESFTQIAESMRLKRDLVRRMHHHSRWLLGHLIQGRALDAAEAEAAADGSLPPVTG